jgi:hypothetical protein
MTRLNPRRGVPVPIVLASLACAALPRAAAAATIQASFAPIRVTARAGQIITTSYELKLEAGQPPAHFKAEIQDWWRSEDGRQSFYAPAGTVRRSCGNWIAANPQEAGVSAGEPLRVRLTITVPNDVKPGGYWCALTLDELADPLSTTPDGVGVRFLASVSTGVYVSVNPIERGADVLSVDIADDRAVARILNTGNAPLTVEGRWEFLKPGATRPAAVVELPRNILLTEPVATGAYSAPLPDVKDLPSGRYVIRLVLDIGLDHYIGVQRELDVRRGPKPAVEER